MAIAEKIFLVFVMSAFVVFAVSLAYASLTSRKS